MLYEVITDIGGGAHDVALEQRVDGLLFAAGRILVINLCREDLVLAVLAPA